MPGSAVRERPSTAQSGRRYSLVSQRGPQCLVAEQLHDTVFTPSLQMPPFRQGLGLMQSSSPDQKSAATPTASRQHKRNKTINYAPVSPQPIRPENHYKQANYAPTALDRAGTAASLAPTARISTPPSAFAALHSA